MTEDFDKQVDQETVFEGIPESTDSAVPIAKAKKQQKQILFDNFIFSNSSIDTTKGEIGINGQEENNDDDDSDYDLDELEATLLGENNTFLKSNTNGVDFGKKLNLSSRTQNDIARSEKKGEKRHNFYGRDDRATSGLFYSHYIVLIRIII
jgi:hypothetical protein